MTCPVLQSCWNCRRKCQDLTECALVETCELRNLLHLSSAQNTSWRLGQNVFLKCRKSCQCVRHQMPLEGNLHNHFKYNKFHIHCHQSFNFSLALVATCSCFTIWSAQPQPILCAANAAGTKALSQAGMHSGTHFSHVKDYSRSGRSENSFRYQYPPISSIFLFVCLENSTLIIIIIIIIIKVKWSR